MSAYVTVNVHVDLDDLDARIIAATGDVVLYAGPVAIFPPRVGLGEARAIVARWAFHLDRLAADDEDDQ